MGGGEGWGAVLEERGLICGQMGSDILEERSSVVCCIFRSNRMCEMEDNRFGSSLTKP